MSMRTRRFPGLLRLILSGYLCCFQFLDCHAASPTTATLGVAGAYDLNDVEGLESFLDGVMALQLEEKDLVGATLAIVKDGHLHFAKGYGYADLAGKIPVDPRTTLFRIGSISKLFIWIGVMQQLELQKLQLDNDMNGYLKVVQIPATWPQPISLIHAMSHTTGFEDRIIGLFARGQRTALSFDDALVQQLPARVRPPGQYTAYSNYAAALSARVVENVSGKGWDDYVEERIFLPLNMQQITTRQPVPENLLRYLAQGYLLQNGHMQPWPFEYVSLPPAGATSASATAMAKFMLELLNPRSYLLMTPALKEQMLLPLFHSDPRLNGMRHGFYELSRHGVEVVGHSGATLAFHSLLALYPKQNVGMFVSYNANGGRDAARQLFNVFSQAYFPGESMKPEKDRLKLLDRFTGTFSSLRVPETTFARLLTLANAFEVVAEPDGYLLLPGENGPRRFASAADDLFVEVNGEERIAFGEQQGRVTHLFMDSMPMVSYARLNWNETPRFNLVFLVLTLGCMVPVLVVWPLSSFRHRARESKSGARQGTAFAVVTVLLLLGFFANLVSHPLAPADILYGLPEWLSRSLWLPLLAVPFTGITLVFAYLGWTRHYWWPSRRVHYTLVALASVAVLWWMSFWRILSLSPVDNMIS